MTAPASVRYLSGFTGSNGWLLIGGGLNLLLTDARYRQQAAVEAPGYRVVVASGSLVGALEQELAPEVGRIGFDPGSVSYAVWQQLTQAPSVEWVAAGDVVTAIRSAKDSVEITAIRSALILAESVLVDVVNEIREGMTELQIAARLDYECRTRGASAMAFDTIVAAGANGALPHARPGDSQVRAGDLLVVDFGCVVDGYCSDITRAVVVGSDVDDEWLEIHAAVDEARAAAIASISPGLAATDVDRVARECLTERGLGEYFSHSLGHGVGIEVHESPRLSATSKDVLAAGMVVTVEPGVYLTGRGGLRLEDMVLVTERGGERLNGLETAILTSGGAA